MMPRHEPTLIAAARSQMTASSPRDTFSQAELTGEVPLTNVSPAPNEREQGFRRQVADDFVVAPTRARQEEPDRSAGHMTCRTRHWCFVYRR